SPTGTGWSRPARGQPGRSRPRRTRGSGSGARDATRIDRRPFPTPPNVSNHTNLPTCRERGKRSGRPARVGPGADGPARVRETRAQGRPGTPGRRRRRAASWRRAASLATDGSARRVPPELPRAMPRELPPVTTPARGRGPAAQGLEAGPASRRRPPPSPERGRARPPAGRITVAACCGRLPARRPSPRQLHVPDERRGGARAAGLTGDVVEEAAADLAVPLHTLEEQQPPVVELYLAHGAGRWADDRDPDDARAAHAEPAVGDSPAQRAGDGAG